MSGIWSKLPGWAKVATIGAGIWAANEAVARLTEKDLHGQLVLITGAGSGIGRLMALLFAKEGCNLALWDINEAGVQETAKDCNALRAGRAQAYVCDVTDRERVYELAKAVKEDFGGAAVDILVNNAGIVSGKKLLENSDRMIQKTFEVNTVSHFWTLKAFLPDMIERNHGHIVTIASASAFIGVSGLCDYSASKWAVFGMEESLRFELQKTGKTGVKTTCVCPFYINTGMFDGVKSRLGPLLPILEPDYVASMIVQAVKRDQKLLCLPRITYAAHLMRGLLPVSVWDAAAHLAGINAGMDEFVGRPGAHGGATGGAGGAGGSR